MMPTPITPLAVTAYTATSALGHGLARPIWTACASSAAACSPTTSAARRWIAGSAASPASRTPACRTICWRWDCRNNRLAWLGLQQDGFIERVEAARERYGSRPRGRAAGHLHRQHRCHRGRLIGASTRTAVSRTTCSGQRCMPRTRWSPSSRAALGLEGPCLTVSTACSSSAKVFANAERMIRLGLVDAAVVGGVDTLCDSVLFGFNALELVSREPCRPFDAARDGISIGEAAGFALLERVDAAPMHRACSATARPPTPITCPPRIREGLGAELALRDALARAGLDAGTGRLHQPAWHRQPEERRSRSGPGQPGVSGHARAPARPRASPATRWAPPASSRRPSRCWRSNTAWCRATSAATRRIRTAATQFAWQQRTTSASMWPEQLVRLRRQQRLPGLRPRGVRRMSVLRISCRGGRTVVAAAGRTSPPCRTVLRRRVRRPRRPRARRPPRCPRTNAAARRKACCWRSRWPARRWR